MLSVIPFYLNSPEGGVRVCMWCADVRFYQNKKKHGLHIQGCGRRRFSSQYARLLTKKYLIVYICFVKRTGNRWTEFVSNNVLSENIYKRIRNDATFYNDMSLRHADKLWKDALRRLWFHLSSRTNETIFWSTGSLCDVEEGFLLEIHYLFLRINKASIKTVRFMVRSRELSKRF